MLPSTVKYALPKASLKNCSKASQTRTEASFPPLTKRLSWASNVKTASLCPSNLRSAWGSKLHKWMTWSLAPARSQNLKQENSTLISVPSLYFLSLSLQRFILHSNHSHHLSVSNLCSQSEIFPTPSNSMPFGYWLHYILSNDGMKRAQDFLA